MTLPMGRHALAAAPTEHHVLVPAGLKLDT